MVNRKAARRYARALFYYARDAGLVPETKATLDALGVLYGREPALGLLLQHPLVPAERKKELLRQALEEAVEGPGRPDLSRAYRALLDFAELLVDKRRCELLPAIVELFGAMADEHAEIVRASVCSAVPMTEPEQQRLAAALSRLFSGTPVLELEVDPSLLAGVIVQVGDTVLDGSVRTSLRVLAQDLKAPTVSGPLR